MDSFIKELLSPDYKLMIAIAGFLTAYFQYKKAKEETNSFRQQLISLLHHAEGVASSLKTITYSTKGGSYSSVNDINAAVESAAQNADALFFGLIESKVGGVSLKNDLDKKYSEWADLELERKKLPLRNFIRDNSKE